MSSVSIDNDIPQWKKDLIARLRNQNKRTATVVGIQQQLYTSPPQRASASVGCSVQQPSQTVAAIVSASKCGAGDRAREKCNLAAEKDHSVKMVQERAWVWDSLKASEPCINGDKNSDSDSAEDLRYGPGIVSKLKNKYLSLAQRDGSTKVRPSILPMRKAASMENILDDDIPAAVSEGNRLFQTRLNGSNDTAKNVPNRYRDASVEKVLKRAHSAEVISGGEERDKDYLEESRPKRESLHEEMLIREGSELNKSIVDKKTLETASGNKLFSHIINRPKRITPIMNEKEKPPVDVVKQTKMIFERRADLRKASHQTGEVAAKVATYKSLVQANKIAKKPPIRVKPAVIIGDKSKMNGTRRTSKARAPQAEKREPPKKVEVDADSSGENHPLSSPIPDVSRIDVKPPDECSSKNTSLSETPDLIQTSSPLPTVNSPSFRISATENFLEEERRISANDRFRSSASSKSTTPGEDPNEGIDEIGHKIYLQTTGNSIRFNFIQSDNEQSHIPVNKVLNTHTPPLQRPAVEVNGINNGDSKSSPPVESISHVNKSAVSSSKISGQLSERSKSNLTSLEIKKNEINSAKTLEPPAYSVNIKSVEQVINVKVPKVQKPPRETESSTFVFDFRDRKDVPDHIHYDGRRHAIKPERPKVGEGGIILLRGASIGESFTDEDEEILRSLEERPPSPCDVTFINDNILIDGKSSLSQKTKKAKMKISFVEDGPEVFEYPSESSFVEESHSLNSTTQIRHSVPAVTGSSSLANYTPKSTEKFQPGVTRSVQNTPSKPQTKDTNEVEEEEVDQPILFSAGANTDILF